MKIGIQTWGSDGDILPFLALAEGLQAVGHQVTVAYTSVDNKDYSAIALQGGFKAFKAFEKFEIGMNEVMTDIVETNDPLKQFVIVMEKYFDPAVEEMYQASTQLCKENDIVIGHMMNHTLLTAAEIFKRPRLVVALAPLAIRTKYIPLFGPNLGPFFNKFTWSLGDYVGRKKLFTLANDIRNSEGLPALKSLQQELYISKDLTLIASSPSLNIRQQDWGDNIQLCGQLNFKAENKTKPLPEGLEEFLNAGPAPVYMTFGSIAYYQAEESVALMFEAVKKSGCRAIIQADWDHLDLDTDIDKHGESIFKSSGMPYQDIFPRCAAVVHHGGAGTTHTALRSGCPSIVVEHAFDQTFWGNELKRVGTAGEVLHRNSLTASILAEAIEKTINNPDMKQCALAISEKMKGEDGVQKAIQLIEDKFNV